MNVEQSKFESSSPNLPNLVSFTSKFTSIFTDITSKFTNILGLDCM